MMVRDGTKDEGANIEAPPPPVLYTRNVVERLDRLYLKLDEEGWHTDANTVALAVEEVMKVPKMTKAEVIDAIKAACGPSRSAWARSLGLSATYINDVVNGRRPPSKAVLDAIGVEKIVDYRLKSKPTVKE